METTILRHHLREVLLLSLTEFLTEQKGKLVIVHTATFYDSQDETHKAVICYYI